ncbi:MAG: cation:proton antiporter regulatory subunit [Desulfohalobiaceae bacterium]
MQIKTSDLPGVGKRYSFSTAQGDKMVIILHHSGHRELFHFSEEDQDEPDFSMNLNDEEARQLGTLLLGVDYQPVADDRMELLLKNVRIEWIKVRPKSSLAQQKIIDSQIRTRTGTTVIGIQRGEKMIGSPDIEEVIQSGDVLMAIGNREQIKKLESLCKG